MRGKSQGFPARSKTCVFGPEVAALAAAKRGPGPAPLPVAPAGGLGRADRARLAVRRRGAGVALGLDDRVRLHSSSVEHGSSFAAKTQAICWCLYHRFRRVSRGEGVVRAGHVRPRAVQPRVGPGQRVARAGHDVVERGVLDPGAVERRDAVRAAEVFEVEQLRVRGAPRRATRIPARIPAQSASP